MNALIQKLIRRENLSVDESRRAMTMIMEGAVTPVLMGAYLTALAVKGPNSDEITGAAMVMREKATRVSPGGKIVVDTCGTGGDHSGTFNISTAAALVATGAGVAVAKHGNRGATSRSGSSDVLEALGVRIDITPQLVSDCIADVGIGFLFAPLLHGSMRFAVPVRKELGFRTIFNVLGPLTNPAGASRQVMGVFEPQLVSLLAEVLHNLGTEHALIVHGSDGLDEITLSGPTRVAEVTQAGGVVTYEISPDEFGLSRIDSASLRVDGPAESAATIRKVLDGCKGAPRDIVLLNAAAAIYVAGGADSLAEAVPVAAKSIDCGAASGVLERLVQLTNRK